MIQETASYIDETISKTGGVYVTDDLTLANIIVSAINRAKMKIMNEKFTPTYVQTATLAATLRFSTAALTKTFKKIIKLQTADDVDIYDWFVYDDTYIQCPSQASGDILTVTYGYIPADLSSGTLAGVLDFPTSVIDPKGLCCFAAYIYFTIQTDEMSSTCAAKWLNLWNDFFDTISPSKGEIEYVVDVYNVGGISND